MGYLLSLTDELKDQGPQQADRIRGNGSSLVAQLDDDTLGRLLEMGGHSNQRKRFVLDASQSLAADSVVKVLKAAATASEETISSSLTRLLSKLATHSQSGPGDVPSQADTALRDSVEELISEWEQEDPNPEAYTLALDSMSKASADSVAS